MRLRIKSTNTTLNEPMKTLIEQKLTKPLIELLGKLDEKADVLLEIEAGKTTRHHHKGKIWIAEANLSLPKIKNVLRAEAITESLEISLNKVKDRLFREIKKYKSKFKDRDVFGAPMNRPVKEKI